MIMQILNFNRSFIDLLQQKVVPPKLTQQQKSEMNEHHQMTHQISEAIAVKDMYLMTDEAIDPHGRPAAAILASILNGKHLKCLPITSLWSDRKTYQQCYDHTIGESFNESSYNYSVYGRLRFLAKVDTEKNLKTSHYCAWK